MLIVKIQNSAFSIINIEFNLPGQFNFNIDYKSYHKIKFITLPQNSEYDNLKKSTKIKIKDCDEENEKMPFDCLNNFVSHKLQCHFPWDMQQNQTKICSGTLDPIFSVLRKIQTGFMKEELEDFGCLLPNCVRHSWVAQTLASFSQATLDNNPFFQQYITEGTTTFYFGTLSTEVDVVEEFDLYGWNSFVADAGGFLGLLLGASILSLIEPLVEYCCAKKQRDIATIE